jgi:hypothetical protein
MEQREYYEPVEVKSCHGVLIIQIDLERGILDLERQGGGIFMLAYSRMPILFHVLVFKVIPQPW